MCPLTSLSASSRATLGWALSQSEGLLSAVCRRPALPWSPQARSSHRPRRQGPAAAWLVLVNICHPLRNSAREAVLRGSVTKLFSIHCPTCGRCHRRFLICSPGSREARDFSPVPCLQKQMQTLKLLGCGPQEQNVPLLVSPSLLGPFGLV